MAKKAKYSAGHIYYCPDDDTILLVKRSGMMHHPHLWDVPGGRSSKADESIEDTAKREAEEELTKLPTEALQVAHFVDKFEKDGKPYHYYLFMYRVSGAEKIRWTPLIELNEENEGLNWFKMEDLPSKDELHFDLTWVKKAAHQIREEEGQHKKASLGRIRLGFEILKPRYEHKYWLPVSKIAAVRDFLLPYVTPDAHGPTYHISNVYLDNDRLELFSEHKQHRTSHFKLRARKYGGSDEVFLEVKRKERGICSKSRNVVPAWMYDHVVRTATTRDQIPFVQLAIERRGHPVVMIDYDREAYSVNQANGRITIDTNVKYALHDDMSFNGETRYPTIPHDMAILEFKYSGDEPPALMRWAAKEFGLKRSSISKYCMTIEKLLDSELLVPTYAAA